MGKWTDALAAHLADEKLRHPPMGAPSKPSKGGYEPFEGEGAKGCREFSGAAGGAANDPTRTCRDCANRLPYGTCGEPGAAGLLGDGEPFGVRWAPDAHAATCKAFAQRSSTRAPDRPHKPTPAEGDVAVDATKRKRKRKVGAVPKINVESEPENYGPSDEEIAEAEAEHKADAERVRLMLESDDALAALAEKCKQQEARIRILEGRVLGLTNQAAEAARLAKSWRMKFERLGKAAT